MGDIAGKVHLVRDDDHGAAFLSQAAHDAQHLAHQLGVKRTGRFVEQHQIRLRREGAGDGDALLLSADRKPG